jgi:hypothetical protein
MLKRRTRGPSNQEESQHSHRDAQGKQEIRSTSKGGQRRRRTPKSNFSSFECPFMSGGFYGACYGESDTSSIEDHDSALDHDSDDDEEYGSQDSPEKWFPSPLTFSSKKFGKRKFYWRQHKGDNSVNFRGSNVASNSEALLGTSYPSKGEKCAWEKQPSALDRNRNHKTDDRSDRQRRTIQILLVLLSLCVGYIITEMVGYKTSEEKDNPRIERAPFDSPGHSLAPNDSSYQDDAMNDNYEGQIGELRNQVQSIRTALQKVAKEELMNSFLRGQETFTTTDIKVNLQGILQGHFFDIQLSTSKMPYSTWIFLKELRNGPWIIKSTEQWLEMTPARETEKQNRYGSVRGSVSPSELYDHEMQSYEPFDLLEISIDTDRPFIVGMRNGGNGELGPVVSIYHERGMCGHYQHEICFGKVTNGFDTLNALSEVGQVVPVGDIHIGRTYDLPVGRQSI